MSITVYFSPTNMTPETYDEALSRLEAAGVGAPPGREHHLCFNVSGILGVVDVWSSLEEFEAFGEILTPILDEIGIEPAEPHISETHNVIKQGERTKAAGA